MQKKPVEKSVFFVSETGRTMVTYTPFMLAGKRIMVCGYQGMLGTALVRRLESEDCEIIRAGHKEVDFLNVKETSSFFAKKKPDAVFMLAARAGGIFANKTRPAEFIYENTMIEMNTIHAAYESGVSKFMLMGNASMYPKDCPQPMKESDLMTGVLDPSHVGIAMAKLTGMVACGCYRRQYGEDNITVIPTNLYGPGDNYDLKNSHVLPALIRKIHAAKKAGDSEVEVWGSGDARREFLYVDDMADAAVFLMERYSDDEPVNVGTGVDISIAELAQIVCRVVEFEGALTFDPMKPDGKQRKVCDVSKITEMGWKASMPLEKGVRHAYDWFLEHEEEIENA